MFQTNYKPFQNKKWISTEVKPRAKGVSSLQRKVKNIVKTSRVFFFHFHNANHNSTLVLSAFKKAKPQGTFHC